MTPAIEIRTNQWITGCLCFVIVGGCLAFALMHFGHSIRQGIERMSEKDLRIALSNEHAAWHTFRAARYTAINTTAQIELQRTSIEQARRKQFMAEVRLSKACLKLKGKC